MSDAWGGSWGSYWGSSWGAGETPRHAGKRRRRYELPNGLHVYATREQAQLLAEDLFNEPVVVVDKPKKKLSIPKMEITLEAIPVVKKTSPTSDDKFIAQTQIAPVEAISYEHLYEQIKRRRRIVAMLLAS